MLLKTRFFLFSTIVYFVSLFILFLASLETFALEASLQKRMLVNYEMIAFLLLTLIFAASNSFFIFYYRKLKRYFYQNASVGMYKDELEKFNQKVNSILNTLQEGVLILDEDLSIVMWNKVAENILNVKFEEGKRDVFEYVSDYNEKLLVASRALAQQALMMGCLLKESVQVGKSHISHFDLVASPVANESRVLLILQDNSSDYKMMQVGKDFIANASHELRTPVTIIKGFAETIRDLPTVSETMLEDITDKILRNCYRMNAIVKNMLVLADLDNRGKIQTTTCDLVTLIESCSYSLLSIYPDACIETLQNQDEILIEGDANLLEQAVMNLLENAVKYSDGPAHIVVTLKREEEHVTLQITDHGIGISEANLAQIFERFYRVNQDHGRKHGGTGLGLSIVQSIVEKHFGKIDVTSEEWKGTTFLLSFTVQEPARVTQTPYA